MKEFFFGKLTLDALPHHWYTIGGTIFIVIMIVAIAMFLTKNKRWGWLWNEWLTSTDPKKIGTMYMIFAAAHVLSRNVRCGNDLASAIDCRRFARISHRGSFSTDFYIAWRHHGLFRDDGIFLWPHELDRTSSNWRARSGFSFLEFSWVLAHSRRRDID